MSIDNDPRPGRPKTPTDEITVKLVKKIIVHHVKNFLEPRGTKTSQENTKEPPLVARDWVTHSTWQCLPAHRGCFYHKTSWLWVGSVTSWALQCRYVSTILRFIPKVKRTFVWMAFFFSGRAFPDGTRAIQHMNRNGVLDGIIILPKHWDSVIEKQGDYIEGLWTDNLKEIKLSEKKYRVHYFWDGLRTYMLK